MTQCRRDRERELFGYFMRIHWKILMNLNQIDELGYDPVTKNPTAFVETINTASFSITCMPGIVIPACADISFLS